MNKEESFENNLLKINIIENNGSIKLDWKGKSVEREPAKFITPILVDVLKMGSRNNCQIILDFRKLDYMNSSTITPIIKILERAKRGKSKIKVIYDKSLKWQDLSFSALEIFQTDDQRVEIKGF